MNKISLGPDIKIIHLHLIVEWLNPNITVLVVVRDR